MRRSMRAILWDRRDRKFSTQLIADSTPPGLIIGAWMTMLNDWTLRSASHMTFDGRRSATSRPGVSRAAMKMAHRGERTKYGHGDRGRRDPELGAAEVLEMRAKGNGGQGRD